MSCWTRTTVLRIPAVFLGFEYWQEWNDFLNEHEEEFGSEPGCFDCALCERLDYGAGWPEGSGDSCRPEDRLDLNLFPDHVRSVPGPFLDYYLEIIEPLPPEENTYHQNDCVRYLDKEEKKYYLPLYRKLFPGFPLEKMDQVHYCCYEWYNGTEAPYYY